MTTVKKNLEREGFVSVGPYSLQAHGVSLQSRGDEADGRGDVDIIAHGSGPDAKDGAVNVRAARQILLDSGSAKLALVQDTRSNGAVLQNANPGTIALVQGSVPGSPHLELAGGENPGISLGLGLPKAGPSIDFKPDGLALRYGPTSAVELDAAGVRLSHAAWSVKLEAGGIELSAGATKVTLGPQGLSINGLTVDLSATTRLAMKGLAVQLDAQAVLQAGGVITKVG
jgi:hypothetical protein